MPDTEHRGRSSGKAFARHYKLLLPKHIELQSEELVRIRINSCNSDPPYSWRELFISGHNEFASSANVS